MVHKRQSDRLPDLGSDAKPAASMPPHLRAPGQPGYPQAHAMEKLRHQHVTRIRKLQRS